MTSTDTSSSTPTLSIADVFLRHLAAGDFEQLATLFEPDVSLSALLPGGLREWHGSERVSGAFAKWFGSVDNCELVETAVGHVGPRLQLRWRARVRGGSFGDAAFVVEQHIYADPGPTGRIQAMSMLCSGFAKE
jgi:SnoaL-like protein